MALLATLAGVAVRAAMTPVLSNRVPFLTFLSTNGKEVPVKVELSVGSECNVWVDGWPLPGSTHAPEAGIGARTAA